MSQRGYEGGGGGRPQVDCRLKFEGGERRLFASLVTGE